jgi:hypothetical protein
LKATPADWNKWKTEFQGSKTKHIFKKNTEEYLQKKLKSCERNMQELCDSIKRLNLQIMGIKEGKEVQAKSLENIFKKKAENILNLGEYLPIHEVSRTPNRHDQNYVIVKTINIENKERILKAEGCNKEKPSII